MPNQAITQITAFRFATVATDTEQCQGDIRAGQVRVAYTLQGRPAVNINTAPAGPVPAPPAPEPPTPPAQDPVLLLIQNGWKVTDFVLTAAGVGTGQPAGFGIGAPYNQNPPPRPRPIANPIFENLDLTFTFPFYCTCVATGKCIAAKYELSVKYDGIAHPVITVEMSDEGDCGNVAALVPDQEVGPPQTRLLNNMATYTYATGVTCDCSKAQDDGQEKPGKPSKKGKDEEQEPPEKQDEPEEEATAQDKCPLNIIVEYVFRTVL